MRIYRAVVLAVLSSLLAAASAHAQQERRSDQGLFEFTALGGIQFGGSPDLVGFSGSLDSGPSFGGIAAVRVSDEGLVALSYTCQRTEFEVTSTGPVPIGSRSIDVNVGYLQLGGELELPVSPRLVPFIGLSVGTTHLTPRNAGATNWFFSGTFTGGLKVPITRHVGLRTQMRLLGTLITADSSFLCESDGGLKCFISSDLSGMIQGDLMAGVYVTF